MPAARWGRAPTSIRPGRTISAATRPRPTGTRTYGRGPPDRVERRPSGRRRSERSYASEALGYAPGSRARLAAKSGSRESRRCVPDRVRAAGEPPAVRPAQAPVETLELQEVSWQRSRE